MPPSLRRPRSPSQTSQRRLLVFGEKVKRWYHISASGAVPFGLSMGRKLASAVVEDRVVYEKYTALGKCAAKTSRYFTKVRRPFESQTARLYPPHPAAAAVKNGMVTCQIWPGVHGLAGSFFPTWRCRNNARVPRRVTGGNWHSRRAALTAGASGAAQR